MTGEQIPPFEIQSLEWMIDNKGEHLSTPKRSAFFEIFWIVRASGIFSIDLEKHEITDNTVYCIDTGQLYSFRTHGNIKGYYISFSPQFLYLSRDNSWPLFESKGYNQHGMAKIIRADKELQMEIEEIVCKMTKEFTNYMLQRSDILKGLLKMLMIYLSGGFEIQNPKASPGRNGELVRRFQGLLEVNVTKKKPVSAYANELGITANYLNEIVKKTTGFPVNYHIQQRKILEAKRQVIFRGISMKEIAYYLGFDDIAHFSKFFKTNTGLSFQKYRKGIEGKSY